MQREFLVFQLYGPMASWGEVAVGELRGSADRPTRSALLGLLAAALGLRRDQEEDHEELAASLRFAVAVDSPGVPLVDYQTAQISRPRKGSVVATRNRQLDDARHALNTVLSQRDYRCDATYRVVVWPAEESTRWPLQELARALERPTFPLSLGRKSCPPALPLHPQVVTAPSIAEALAEAEAEIRKHSDTAPWWRLSKGSAGARPLYWEGDRDVAGIEPNQVTHRRDDPVSRRRWSFRDRREFAGSLPGRQRSERAGEA